MLKLRYVKSPMEAQGMGYTYIDEEVRKNSLKIVFKVLQKEFSRLKEWQTM